MNFSKISFTYSQCHRRSPTSKTGGNRGFTLIELIVALALFSIISLSAAGIFISGIKFQRKVFALQNIQENGRFLLESISKEIRMSYINSFDSATLNLTNAKGLAVNYSFDNTNKQLKKNGEVLNSGKVEITGRFDVQTLGQPRVTIVMMIKNISAKSEQQTKINLQTTISLRGY